jgi:hypothetical protein
MPLSHEKQLYRKGKSVRFFIKIRKKRVVIKFLKNQIAVVFCFEQIAKTCFAGTDIAFDAYVVVWKLLCYVLTILCAKISYYIYMYVLHEGYLKKYINFVCFHQYLLVL